MQNLLTYLWLAAALLPQPETLPASSCHAYIDYKFIWTLEMVDETPILNIVTFDEGSWELRPSQIHLYSVGRRRREAEITKFSIDTGVFGDPFITNFLRVHGNSFFGLDLEGHFEGFQELSQAAIELGDHRFVLQPIDCLDFETLAEKINQVNVDSPDLRQDYAVLKINLVGRLEPRSPW